MEITTTFSALHRRLLEKGITVSEIDLAERLAGLDPDQLQTITALNPGSLALKRLQPIIHEARTIYLASLEPTPTPEPPVPPSEPTPVAVERNYANLTLLNEIAGSARYSTGTESLARVLRAYLRILERGELPTEKSIRRETGIKPGGYTSALRPVQLNDDHYLQGIQNINYVLQGLRHDQSPPVLHVFPNDRSDRIYAAYKEHEREEAGEFNFEKLCVAQSETSPAKRKDFAEVIVNREIPGAELVDLDFARVLEKIQREALDCYANLEAEETNKLSRDQRLQEFSEPEWTPEGHAKDLSQILCRDYLLGRLEPKELPQTFDDYYKRVLQIVAQTYLDNDNDDQMVRVLGGKLLAAIGITENNLRVAWSYERTRGSGEEVNLEQMLTEARKIVHPSEQVNYEFIIENLLQLEEFCEARFLTSLDEPIKDTVKQTLLHGSKTQNYAPFLENIFRAFSRLGVNNDLFKTFLERTTGLTEIEYNIYKSCKTLAEGDKKTVRKKKLLEELSINQNGNGENNAELTKWRQFIETSDTMPFEDLTGERFTLKGENGAVNPRTLPVTTSKRGCMGRQRGHWSPILKSPITITMKK